jgi:hypothetical protein
VVGLPRLCPDLSATVYGARRALSAMARALGKANDADRWDESAEKLRALIVAKLYSAEDAAFYDVDAHGKFVRIRSDVISRVCGERVVSQDIFDQLWERQLHNPKAFWTRYPLPSIAMDDPAFVSPIPANSWGGASQALTALRAPRWLEYYGKAAELGELMDRWCEAIAKDMSFRQQMDPVSGVFTPGGAPGYSPAALAMVDFTWRLAGIYEREDGLEWNARPGHAAANLSRYAMRCVDERNAVMQYDDDKGVSMELGGKRIARVTSGIARLVTDKDGHAKMLVGISTKSETVAIQVKSQPVRRLTIAPNELMKLA